MAIADLSVTVTPPTVDVAVVSNCAGVPLSRCNLIVLCFKGVVIPLPCDVACNGAVSSDVRALGAGRQCPIKTKYERGAGRASAVIGVHGVRDILQQSCWRSPNASVAATEVET